MTVAFSHPLLPAGSLRAVGLLAHFLDRIGFITEWEPAANPFKVPGHRRGPVSDPRRAPLKILPIAPYSPSGYYYGNRIHHGNLVLGRIALCEGNIKKVKSRLLAAGKTTGSPQLDSFGPNLVLAKDLLERGERNVVLK